MPNAFQRELSSQARQGLAKYPELVHTWRDSADSLILEFPSTAPQGFMIRVVARENAIDLHAGGFLTHFDDPPDPAQLAAKALGLARDLLSPAMRLREFRAGGVPYRWQIQYQQGDRWQDEEEFGLLFWNYFGQRSKVVYQNDQLPSRHRAV